MWCKGLDCDVAVVLIELLGEEKVEIPGILIEKEVFDSSGRRIHPETE
ncbi:hypothetical protein [Salinibacillus kushneri]|nr:hypothetical protein [Salinibacillus kushneri]